VTTRSWAARRLSGRPARAGWALLLLFALGCHRQNKVKPIEPVEQVYKQALEKMGKKRYFAARSLLQSLLTRIPQDDRTLLPLVQIRLGDAFYLDGGILNLGEALGSYRNFLTYYPQREEAAYAQYQVGMCYFGQVLAPDRDQDLTFKAIAEFEKVERLYPDSPYVEQAGKRILECRQRLAAHEFGIGRYYYKRKRYLAAADRFRVILDLYPHFSRTEEVIYLLGCSLFATSNPDEGRLYFDKLFQEFPDGKFTRPAKALLKKQGKG
jgi:outer membrane protein assembly factor BamD